MVQYPTENKYSLFQLSVISHISCCLNGHMVRRCRHLDLTGSNPFAVIIVFKFILSTASSGIYFIIILPGVPIKICQFISHAISKDSVGVKSSSSLDRHLLHTDWVLHQLLLSLSPKVPKHGTFNLMFTRVPVKPVILCLSELYLGHSSLQALTLARSVFSLT